MLVEGVLYIFACECRWYHGMHYI